MRLIDADALKERAIRVSTVKEHCYFKAVGTREIDKAPTVDAVPVIRCKDCVYSYKVDSHIEKYDCRNSTRFGMSMWSKPDDFCSHGERKDNG